MKINCSSDVEARAFSGDQVKGVVGRVLVGSADGAPNFCMRLFELAPGGYTPKHSHAWEHEVFIHQGTGAVFKAGEWVPVCAGTAIFIAPGEEHQLKNAGADPFVFVCVIPSGVPEL